MKYNIQGEPMPVVICHLEAGESMITERGSMVWMSANMRMETKAGGLGKALGRMFGGESLFQNTYTAEGGPGMIAFASSFPGAIRAVEITPNMPVIAQKSAFLAATPGVDLSIHFQKKVGAGFFGGEGFIMQKLSGHGMAFLEIDGSAVEYTLAPGQQIIVDTGNLAMVDARARSISRPSAARRTSSSAARAFSTPSSPVRGASYCRRWRCPPSRARSSRICRRSRTDAHTAKWIESGGRKPPPSIQNGYFFKGT